jgi:STE24 endopeptidase
MAGGIWIAVLAVTGWGSRLPLVGFVAVIALGWELVTFPFAAYGSFILERRYGLSSESFRVWLGDHLKALGLVLAMTEVGAFAMYEAMRLAGSAWWVVTAAVFAAAGVLLSRVTPVLLLPLFYQFRPLDREGLRDRLIVLSRRAGVPVLGIFEWGLGEKTTRANAALVGAGRTRRILVSDTLLKDYTDDEIEVILAHEIGHHVHHDLWTALALETGIVAVALLTAHLTLTAGGLAPSNVGALPWLVLIVGAVSLALSPLGNAWSRHNERRADRFALTLTGQNTPFISAMRRLGAQNLAEERPARLVRWFFHTHPTIEERIAAARVELA